MGLTELLILLVILAVLAGILWALVALMGKKKNKIKIALDKNIPIYDLEELELRELPSGGARMVQRSFEEVMRQASELESLGAIKKRPRSKVLKTDLTREAVLARRAAAMAAAKELIAGGDEAELFTEPDVMTDVAVQDVAIQYVAGQIAEEAVEQTEPVAADFDEVDELSVVDEFSEAGDFSVPEDLNVSETQDLDPPSWAAAAVRADEYQSTPAVSSPSQSDFTDDEWLDDGSSVPEVQSGRQEPSFSMMRFDDERGLVSDDELEDDEINGDEVDDYEFDDDDDDEEDDEDDEDDGVENEIYPSLGTVDDEETADYFLDSAVDEEDDDVPAAESIAQTVDVFALDSFSSTDELPEQEIAGDETENKEAEMLESALYHPRQPVLQREPEELDDVLDELLHERGVSTVVDYSRVQKPELEFQQEEQVEEISGERPEEIPEELPEETPQELPQEIPEELPEEIPQELPQEIPQELPQEIPQELPVEVPDQESNPEPELETTIPEEVPEEMPKEIPEPMSEPEMNPASTPEEAQELEEEEELLPDFDSELEAEPEPQPQPVDSFAAVDNKDDIDDLFKDEDQQRRLGALEQEQGSTPKRLMSWAGAAFGKLTTSLAESRARAAEEKAVRDELADARAQEQAQLKAQARAEAQKQAQADEQARRTDNNHFERSDYQDPLADYSVDDESADHQQTEPAPEHHYDENYRDSVDDTEQYAADLKQETYEPEPAFEPQPIDDSVARYGESPYKQHQFGQAAAVEAAATAASATAVSSAAKQPHSKRAPRTVTGSPRDNQLSLEMPADDHIDTGFSEVLVMSVMARPHTNINGDELLPALLSAGLRFGDMSIFHRHAERKKGPVLFSVANALNPGTFDLNEISNFSTQGITFFMTLPNVANNMLAFEQMLATARHVQSALDADLKDDNRSVITAQTVEHYRQRIRDFELQQLKNSRQK